MYRLFLIFDCMWLTFWFFNFISLKFNSFGRYISMFFFPYYLIFFILVFLLRCMTLFFNIVWRVLILILHFYMWIYIIFVFFRIWSLIHVYFLRSWDRDTWIWRKYLCAIILVLGRDKDEHVCNGQGMHRRAFLSLKMENLLQFYIEW